MLNLKFDPRKDNSNLIMVIGVGGGGSNAVSYMYTKGIKDVDFMICNTDAQSLELSPIPNKIQLGSLGLGAGSIPEVGREAAVEKIEQVKDILKENTKMLFITAGMGGGTGTGGAPVIAQAARELDILTVGIVTMPFSFEGRKRRQQAEAGIQEMRKYVDTLLLINNDKLRELHGNLTLREAFHQADEVLNTAARGIAEIITLPHYINVDFKDVQTVMKNSGKAIMGSAIAEGENRAIEAVEKALNSPLLDDNDIKGAQNILLSITSGTKEITMDEVTEITEHIQTEAGQTADVIWGTGMDESLGEKICVTIIATGFDPRRKADPMEGKILVGTLGNAELKPEQPETKKNEQADKQEIRLTIRESMPSVQKTETQQSITFGHTEMKKVQNQPTEEKPQQPEITELKKKEEVSLSNAADEKHFFVPRTTLRETASTNGDDNADHQKRAEERIKKLKELSLKLKTPGGLAELEREPAYVRRKTELKDPPPNTGQQTARSTLYSDDDKNTDIRSNNSYLHDNVD